MTVRAVEESRAALSGDAGLFFVLNRAYLAPFRILIWSLLQTRSLLDCPIVVLSDEKAVLADPLVRCIANRSRLVTSGDIKALAPIQRGRVEEKHQLEWIAKYTFLKWMIFEDYGFQRGVFLDADIIALKNIDELVTVSDIDLRVAPRFPPGSTEGGSAWRASMDRFLRGRHTFEKRRFNSGVMSFGPRLMSSAFQRELIALASRREFATEQSAVYTLLKEKADFKVTYLPLVWNFKATVIDALAPEDQVRVMDDVKLLHFAGGRKPWRHDSEHLTITRWRKVADEADAYAPGLFSWRDGAQS